MSSKHFVNIKRQWSPIMSEKMTIMSKSGGFRNKTLEVKCWYGMG